MPRDCIFYVIVIWLGVLANNADKSGLNSLLCRLSYYAMDDLLKIFIIHDVVL